MNILEAARKEIMAGPRGKEFLDAIDAGVVRELMRLPGSDAEELIRKAKFDEV